MGDLARTMIVCGLISGTQPVTVMGLLVLLGGTNGRRNAIWYLLGCFTVQAVVVLSSGVLVGGRVDGGSTAGRSLIGLRIAAGVVLLALGVWLRRPPKVPPAPRPKVLDRLTGLAPWGAFVAGVAIADYQGSVVAAVALAGSDVGRSDLIAAWLLYCLLATGIPASVVVVVSRSASAHARLERSIDWVMAHRRTLGSWFCLAAGVALMADGLTAWLLAG